MLKIHCHMVKLFVVDVIPCVLTNPCDNGGTCNNDVNTLTYTCQCANGYEGTNCKSKKNSVSVQ